MSIESFAMLIDGEWRESSDGETFECINPFTGEPWARVPRATKADVDAAVRAAERAFTEGPWASSTPKQRGALLRRLAVLITEQADPLATTLVRENGKLIREVGGQARALADNCYFFAGVAEMPLGDTLASSMPEHGGLHGPRADRRCRRDHAVEQPADAADHEAGARRWRPGARWSSSRRRSPRRPR